MISDIAYSLLMGLLQGLTEWLPISSSGHLVIVQEYFVPDERIMFIAILHLATLLSALVYFRMDIRPLLNLKNPQTHKVIIASIPIIIVGFLLMDIIEAAFSSAIAVAVFLIITGCVLIANAFLKPKKKKIKMRHALMIGMFQVFALLPGISRSGTTITIANALGIEWSQAAKFSFFISFIPIVFITSYEVAIAWNEFNITYLIGFVVAFLVGYATIGLMMRMLQLGKFHYFGIYPIIAGVVILMFLLHF